MENASKALIIAGAILVSLLVISLGVYIFNKMSGYADTASDMTEEEILEFNNQLTPYLGENIAGSKVNQLITVAFSINQSAEIEAKTVGIYYGSKTLVTKAMGSETTPNKVTSNQYYNVEVSEYSSGLISSIKISDIT